MERNGKFTFKNGTHVVEKTMNMKLASIGLWHILECIIFIVLFFNINSDIKALEDGIGNLILDQYIYELRYAIVALFILTILFMVPYFKKKSYYKHLESLNILLRLGLIAYLYMLTNTLGVLGYKHVSYLVVSLCVTVFLRLLIKDSSLYDEVFIY